MSPNISRLFFGWMQVAIAAASTAAVVGVIPADGPVLAMFLGITSALNGMANVVRPPTVNVITLPGK